ncbi:TetR/AcrR family transcriptional regulator [Myceligenerans salitolerans]|uniref:TetR family transcriptional regulator n=1 Tax=Myceligenerans salitolerans TaxID=1230528 RepID=A0ABS3I827_9MICO|nr:TetR/AcrR family transcriptional regulator [Myceligenerans salitolerans]MBO0609099.1 TetR family transcriptional regulator [Myceligenerans salitolerans]
MTDDAPPSLRERTRRAVHQEIAGSAMRLFLEQGFEATTVDQIAAATGISRRSFFRYFATKEDVVLGELVGRGHAIASELAARPAEEPPWTALRAALVRFRDTRTPDTESELRLGEMLYATPTLRARHLEKQLAWQDLLVPVLADRLRATAVEGTGANGVGGNGAGGTDAGGADPELAAAAIVAGALACLDIAGAAWVRRGGTVPLDKLYDDAVATIRST